MTRVIITDLKLNIACRSITTIQIAAFRLHPKIVDYSHIPGFRRRQIRRKIEIEKSTFLPSPVPGSTILIAQYPRPGADPWQYKTLQMHIT